MCEKKAEGECWGKMMVFERRDVEVVDFNKVLRVSVVGRCEVVLGGEKM